MDAQLSDDDVTVRARNWQRRLRLPIPYLLVLFLPVAADIFHVPIAHSLLWPATLAIFTAALVRRGIVDARRPNPATGVDPSIFRQRLAELESSTRRRNILFMAFGLAGMLWTVPQAASPMKAVLMLAVIALIFGGGTAAFLLNIKVRLRPKGPVFRDDELTAVLRGRAAQWGGLIVLVAVFAAFSAIMLRPTCAQMALSVLVWTACEAPLLVFAWLEYRTERNA